MAHLRAQEALLHQIHAHFREMSEPASYVLSDPAEWFLDNIYLVQQAIRQIRDDVTKDHRRRMRAGPAADAGSQIYDLACDLISNCDGRLDMDQVTKEVYEHQEGAPLTIAQIWALPTQLRLALVTLLAHSAARIVGLQEQGAEDLIFSAPTTDTADEDVVVDCIRGLRTLANYDWLAFFVAVSRVEAILNGDPAGLYAQMEDKTRQQYRQVVQELASAAGWEEEEVAREAVALANEQCPDSVGDGEPWAGLELPRAAHVGYYLVASGSERLRERLRVRLALRLSWRARLLRRLSPHLPQMYVASILLITGIFAFLPALYVRAEGGTPVQIIAAVLLTFLPAMTAIVNLVNWLVNLTVPPHQLPKLDFREGIPACCHTMVVIPALLTAADDIADLLRKVELHYLSNGDPNLHFALLTDFANAPRQQMPDDEALLAQLEEGVKELNQRYEDAFYLFHREREWNPREGCWMGWECKRGKLVQFNRLLQGKVEGSYTTQIGDVGALASVKYVITVDADTLLPRDTARRLVATLAHPLNRPRFDPRRGAVVEGHAVLQPRMEIRPQSAGRSWFTKIFLQTGGLDLYQRAVSDVYHDLFGEGIYAGKGIYDLDTFSRALADRVPENSLLSHDLFEGIYCRAGLVTDVVLYEEHPPHYLAYARRLHRWIRGDWQMAPWLLPRIPRANGQKTANDLTLLGRWKIWDNIRRSLLAPALLALLALGWLWLPGPALFWSASGLLILAVPHVTSVLVKLRQPGAPDAGLVRSLGLEALRWLLSVVLLPYEVLLALDAISRTVIRLSVTRRRLLQWPTAAHTVRQLGRVNAGVQHWRQMVGAPLLALVLLLTSWGSAALPTALPLLLLWLLSPTWTYLIDRPLAKDIPTLAADERRQLRLLARRTWFFFERFVGPEDNWLPPDHFQELPRGVSAHRTSPTNVGLYLLSALGAHDLGYVNPLELALRLRSAVEAMERVERYRGHFLNWIETRTLAPLPPRYISTVDSGNLAACLLTLAQGCRSLPLQPVWRWEAWQGYLDALALLGETVAEVGGEGTGLLDHLQEIEAQVFARHDAPRAGEVSWLALLDRLATEEQAELERRLQQMIEGQGGKLGVGVWSRLRGDLERVRNHLSSMERHVDQLQPWLRKLRGPPVLFTEPNAPPRLRTAWDSLVEALPPQLVLADVPEVCAVAGTALQRLQDLLATQEPSAAVVAAREWCQQLRSALDEAARSGQFLLQTYSDLRVRLEAYVDQMDFSFLFDRQRQVFHIGYNVDAGQLDFSAYDFLASEARSASLIAIAKNDVPQKHWLRLARPLARVEGGRALLSWSGTMFEYLMPALWFRQPEASLLDESCRTAIRYQIAYARRHSVPWGISESGFYAFDAAMNYNYRAFGAPGLGLKRGLADDLVVAPYSSLLALSLAPREVVENLQKFYDLGALGRYGFYEAIDFTPARLPPGEGAALVKSYMAHHQGLVLLALVNYLQGERMVDRLHANPRIRSVEFLLHERTPPQEPVARPAEDTYFTPPRLLRPDMTSPWQVPLASPRPEVHTLSNGRYHTLITNAGGGYSRRQGLALTRWRADATRDHWGCWLYLQDVESGALWSAGLQPTGVQTGHQEVNFHPHMAAFLRRDDNITLRMEVTVAPADDVEVRRVRVSNGGDGSRSLRLTSYGEVVLASVAADRRHPAFGKLFVESEYVPAYNALLFRRRPSAADEEQIFLAHMLVVEEGEIVTGAFATERASFLGRGRTARHPAALADAGWLAGSPSGGAGSAPLDPIMALGQVVELAPNASLQLALVTAVASSRSDVLALLDSYQTLAAVDRAFDTAMTYARHELRELQLTVADLEWFQRLLSLLLHPHSALRAPGTVRAHNGQGNQVLKRLGITGENPILLVLLHEAEELTLGHQLLKAQSYWRRRGLQVDLVVAVDATRADEEASIANLVERLMRRSGQEAWLNRPGGVYLFLRSQQTEEGGFRQLRSAARVMLDGDRGSLAKHLAPALERLPRLPTLVATRPLSETARMPPLQRPDDLQFDNGLGGFSADGREYVLYLQAGETTPAPWINVIANPDFGCLVSESGGGYTWAENSAENRLTSWRNDPVSDAPAEALYLRDEETAAVWSPTPQPSPTPAPYLVRHGAGYTAFEHHSHGLRQRLRLFVPPDIPLKIVQLRLENWGQRPRRITATYYAEWVLGNHREVTQPFLVPEYDAEHRALLVRNPFHETFPERVAFLAASEEPHGLTSDRSEFLGRLGTLAQPAALGRIGLENRVQTGLDCCAVLQVHVDLGPGETRELYFLLGQDADRESSLALLRRFQEPGQVAAAWQAVHAMWNDLLETVQVQTPDGAMDLFLNRWLLYQTVSCRLWGRTALYQSSGAYGFRDQLQDVMAVVHTRPDLARAHILRAAAHQFEAGDVLHWWHPPADRGLRTHISDSLLWLPYVTAHYIAATGDLAILDEGVSFLQGEGLPAQETDVFGSYEMSADVYTLYEHCRRALEKGMTRGPHGLPLIGAGDWNDGFNRLGREGRGESVWLGWFLYATLEAFAALCDRTEREEKAETYRQRARSYREALERVGWDGAWYLRAFDDEGKAVGSAQNVACQIAANAQSWAVLSEAADPERAERAMQSLLEKLVRWNDRLLLLFTPPFDRGPEDPGYVKGYVPGVRENGGQYTHAALWAVWAFARLGAGDLASRLLRMLHPIYHADTLEKATQYKVEPYVVSADVYGAAPHTGRGGWTWYTGSAGWMYRVGLEAILGICRTEEGLRLDPCIPRAWQQYAVRYRQGCTTFQIHVENPQRVSRGVSRVTLDGEVLHGKVVPWLDDGEVHRIVVRLGTEE